ncbi:DUF3696 domain-containing protein [Fusobacterium sp. PH5-44]|uniref:DUF3696 domain-containing protein n=1 Tax=unclassified Fusobacterium TaxID=2648384 RepID=UPI003D1995A5
MITKLNLSNFKCFQALDINFGKLNLLTGINSSGKSSIIQSILLVKQNFLKLNQLTKGYEIFKKFSTEEKKKVFISLLKDFDTSGEYVKITRPSNLLNENANSDEIKIRLEFDNDGFIDLEVNCKEGANKLFGENVSVKNIENFLKDDNFSYLSTEHISPRSSYEFSRDDILRNNIGTMGEFTVHYLAEQKNKDIDIPNLKHSGSHSTQIHENIEKWMSNITKDIVILAESNEYTHNSILRYSYGGKIFWPQDIGYGVTHALPIVTLLLKSKVGDIVIIENPETHLHPAAQVELASLCALASANGVQLIIETHSDHFLNAIRVAIKKGVIASTDVKINYFSKKEIDDTVFSTTEEIIVNEDGSIHRWPEGFFDEIDIQLRKLLW